LNTVHIPTTGIGHCRESRGLVFRRRANIGCPSRLDASGPGCDGDSVARVVRRSEFIDAALLCAGREIEVAMPDVRRPINALDIADVQPAVLDAHRRRNALFAPCKTDDAIERVSIRQPDRQACGKHGLGVRQIADVSSYRVIDEDIDVLAQRVAEVGLGTDQIDIRPDRKRLSQINAGIGSE
jgi:hypothetical protein